MKLFLSAVISCICAHGIVAEEDISAKAKGTYQIEMPNTVIQDVLEFYSRQVRKPVFMATNVHGAVTMKFTVPTKDVPAVMRKSLLENNGIELRELPTGEVLAEWSKDPKYPRRTGPGNSATPGVSPRPSAPTER